MPRGENEAVSRVLIDRALEFSGWNILDRNEVQFEANIGSHLRSYRNAGRARQGTE